jgi:predicted nuclease with TOPRIM domain
MSEMLNHLKFEIPAVKSVVKTAVSLSAVVSFAILFAAYFSVRNSISYLQEENGELKSRIAELSDDLDKVKKINSNINEYEFALLNKNIADISTRVNDVERGYSLQYSKLVSIEYDVSNINSEMSLIRLQMLTR